MVVPRRAVFLDRDGVINDNIYYADTGSWEAPRRQEDFRLSTGALAGMKLLQDAGFVLFVVSNQPNQAKAKATRADHDAIHAAMIAQMTKGGISVAASYYCFHHPQGVVPEFSGACRCRKPSPHFLLTAAGDWNLDLPRSWMVGDRDSDIECGYRAGVRTIRIGGGGEGTAPDFSAVDLAAAADIILADYSEALP